MVWKGGDLWGVYFSQTFINNFRFVHSFVFLWDVKQKFYAFAIWFGVWIQSSLEYST